MILRIEDTDLARSTRESEQAVLRDLTWLGIKWDEGPDVGGPCAPYRQSERGEIYRKYVDKLVATGKVYKCFCTDEELQQMKVDAEKKGLPPRYYGKWATASQAEVDAEIAKGTPFCYRFRVPQDDRVTIQDMIRGEVSWATNTLGDFVIMRSNGLPVYNFCVAIDDATMGISHVIRAEEHLPNTLRQVLIYRALDLPQPKFGHVSLILAPDKSKLSKRHGATSVGEFKERGYLPEAMVNFLSLLGWNDGTEEEIFSVQQLVDKFTIERVTKSGAVFDETKLMWMNGQHLRALPGDESTRMVAERWLASGLVNSTSSPAVKQAADLIKNGIEMIQSADGQLAELLGYPMAETIASKDAAKVVEDDLKGVANAVLKVYDSGDLVKAIQGGPEAWKAWTKDFGKATDRKGKRLFMPMRIALTGSMHGPDVGELLSMLLAAEKEGCMTDKAAMVPLDKRMASLRAWASS
eukprot:jgi/Mesvir1/14955/Mv14626-RA.2